MRISDWSSDVCSSDLHSRGERSHADRGCPIIHPASAGWRIILCVPEAGVSDEQRCRIRRIRQKLTLTKSPEPAVSLPSYSAEGPRPPDRLRLWLHVACLRSVAEEPGTDRAKEPESARRSLDRSRLSLGSRKI